MQNLKKKVKTMTDTLILNIETSGDICSVALTRNGAVDFERESTEGMKHAELLAPFADEAMAELRRRGDKLSAVAVSIGPGSYTGLRIGLSMGKGLSYGLDVPLLGIPTLEVMAVKAMFRNREWTGEEILVPMLDARRMEVYTAAYDFALHELLAPQPLILTEDSYTDLLTSGREVWFFGDGSDKFKEVCKNPSAHWIDGLKPHARDMTALSEKYLREGRTIDRAYSVPLYLKEYQATKPINTVIGSK